MGVSHGSEEFPCNVLMSSWGADGLFMRCPYIYIIHGVRPICIYIYIFILYLYIYIKTATVRTRVFPRGGDLVSAETVPPGGDLTQPGRIFLLFYHLPWEVVAISKVGCGPHCCVWNTRRQ